MNQALKKSCRAQLTKLVNQAYELTSTEFSVKEAIVLISRIKTANESLNKLNKEVASEIPVDLIESECEKIIEYEDKAVAAITELEFEVARVSEGSGACAAVNVVADEVTSQASGVQGRPRQVDVDQHNKRAVRLPKLELTKFNGDYHMWPAFWEQYNTAIHNNDDLNDSSKFTYLKSLLTGNAAITIQGLTSSCSSYKDAIKLLTEQYGNNERIVDSYIQQLLTLTPVKNKNDVTSLRKLHNTTSKIIRSLETLGMSSENYGMMVKSIVLKALPFSMKTEFHKRQVTSDFGEKESVNASDAVSNVSNKEISYERQIFQLLSFIKLEIDSLEQARVLEGDIKNNDDRTFHKRKDNTCTAAGLFTSVKEQCLFCKSFDHNAMNCTSNVSLDQKKEILKSNKRCYRCTKSNHNSKFCRVKVCCSRCKAKHATSMCDPNYKRQQNYESKTGSSSKPNVNALVNKEESNPPSTNLLASGQLNNVYLQTACAQIISNDGVPTKVRMVIDGGSQLTFIKECLSRELNLPVVGTHAISIMSFGKSEKAPARLCKKVSVILKSNYNDELVTINAVEVPEICFDSLVPPSLEDPSIYEFSINFPLADSYNFNVEALPGISLLIGADCYWKIVSNNTQNVTDNLMGIDTKFGWTIHGVNSGHYDEYAFAVNVNVANILHVQCEQVDNVLDLKRFWDLEAIGIDNANVTEKSQTNNFMSDNITFENNRYRISLPWIDPSVHLNTNFNGALNRLKTLTRKLANNGKLKEYDSAVREYMNNDCAELSPEVINSNRTYFMPHRAVYRNDKDTTKIRVVFDASAHAPGLPSLNDVLLQGENLVPHLFQVLLNFRMGKIALIADIEKAFLQIEITERDRDSHSFLWYKESFKDISDLSEIVTYRMKRVTFGVNCSPFLLAATLKKHLQSQPDDLRNTSDILASSFYVDDLVVAVDEGQMAEQIYRQSKEIMVKAGMNLRKWNSNDVALRKMMGNIEDESNAKKVLGIFWYLNDDDLTIDLDSILAGVTDQQITKRRVLQAVSKIFDPLGFLSPFTIRAKILLQEIWKSKLDWDSLLPENLANDWLKWCSELTTLKEFSIPRCVLENKKYDVSLHVFADASPAAFGAVAYLRVTKDNGEVDCRLMMAKNRISPINTKGEKDLTLPKLELTAAVCAARLQNFILVNVNVEIKHCTLWTDSKITLHWIRGKATNWKPYICNRVVEIKKLSYGVWRHCPGKQNPADLLTRGVRASILVESTTWKNGPDWLKGSCESWPEEEPMNVTKTLSVLAIQQNRIQINETVFPVDKYSSLEKILRVTAWIYRFVYNLKNKNNKRSLSLTAMELRESENYWIKTTQKQYFHNEISALIEGKNLESSSTIITLNPFLYNDLMRLGGRLHESSLPFQTKHPVILPKKSIFTDRIIWNAHILTKHGGVNSTITELRKRFWIVQCRQRVKSVLNKCISCKRLRGKSGSEHFAPLPKGRVSAAAAPFKVTGTDFAGPIYIITKSKNKQKVYIMVFTCAAIRAIHLEIVPDLSTESCINALRRFISKRGVPNIIYSDNAKTFKRTAMELQELQKIIKTEGFQEFISTRRIEWRFIVERAAWWGGFWERMIKTIKDALKLTLGKKSLNYDELQTELAEVEASVNSRPLTYIDNDGDDLLILSPSHFLLGSNECGFSMDSTCSMVKRNDILQSWKKRNELNRKFWKRWSCDYLQQLRLFHKQDPVKSKILKVGDVCLLHDQNLPRLLWKLVRITQVFQGRDGRIRACEVITGNKTTLRRPIQLLFPLEITAAGEDVKNPEDAPGIIKPAR